MDNIVQFKEQLIKIEESAVIHLKHWWGLRYAGYEGIIVNKNKELYKYHIYNITPPKSKNKDCNYITKIKVLTLDEYERITKFIETEIIGKEFENYRVYDIGYNLYINYNGIKMGIINNKGYDNDLKIYDKAEKVLKELI